MCSARVCRLPFTLSVSPSSPHKTLQSLIAAVRAKGANASYGTTAPTGQVAGAMMKNILKLAVVEVPYRTAANSVNDLDSGAVDYMMYDPIFAIPRHREGKGARARHQLQGAHDRGAGYSNHG